ncbi:glycoside hydrolase family 3 N-terminal domain-containing protein [Isoptericola jiangsuensis]|uniref:glycoside hydrolase family 3 N-terminal domain-containing protein n=1 Tax=Isoptericola jiangsuensis TaxID=548579 RepID=UPI003AAA6613
MPRPRGASTPFAGTAVLLGALLLAACTAPGGSPSGTLPDAGTPGTRTPGTPSPSAPTPEPSGSPSPAPSSPSPTLQDVLDSMSLEEKVGQLLVVGAPVLDGESGDATRTALRDHHAGGIFLHGRSEAGADAVRDLVDGYVADAPGDTELLVATDQEGGFVQVLQGPGFSEIPRATVQADWSRDRLEREATTWASELADVGVNLNLAPVMDLVPPDNQTANEPIGYYSRNYGNTADQVVESATAFSAGMQASGVEPVIKHFPGLGYVTQNTDTSGNVVDDTVTADSASVDVFAQGIDAGARFVMVSNAVYAKIDPDVPAPFSEKVVDGLLRDDLGFDGVIITDDVSAAAAVQYLSPAERAVDAIDAGVDVVLASADPAVVPAMADAIAERARDDAEFAQRVDESASRVLAAKADL